MMKDELTVLKERVRTGNEKLIAAWPLIWEIQNEAERDRELARWDRANVLLDALCMELMYRLDYRDCFYIESGKKTKPCVRRDGFFCFVCPSEKSYWDVEKKEEDYDF